MARLLSSTLLLQLAFCSAEPQYTLTVQQPPAVTVSRGESVTLNCSFQGREIKRSFSHWNFYRNNIQVANWTWKINDQQPLLTAQPNEKASVQHGDHTSSLVIADLQISDAGTYICTVKITTPPPTQFWTGTGTVLRILAPPRVSLSLSNADDPSLVTCMVSEFYPASINITLNSTCGGCQELEDSTPKTQNLDGTYNTTPTAKLTKDGCVNGIEVVCNVKHETGQWRETLRIAGEKTNASLERLLLPILSTAAVVLVFLPILILLLCKYKFCCCDKRSMRRSSSMDTNGSKSKGRIAMSELKDDPEEQVDLVYAEPVFPGTSAIRTPTTMDKPTEYSVLCHK